MTFDDLGHRIAIKDPDRGDRAFKSNGAGELTEQTDANGDVVTFGHDDLGRVIDRSLNGQLESRWTFDLMDARLFWPNLQGANLKGPCGRATRGRAPPAPSPSARTSAAGAVGC